MVLHRPLEPARLIRIWRIVPKVKRLRRIGLWLVVTFLLLSFLVFRILGKPILYQVSPNLQGWFTVQYNDMSCPPLATKGFSRVVVVPANRFACTSSPMEMRWHYFRFEYLTPDGRSIPIPRGDHNDNRIRAWLIGSSPDRHQEYNWIGPSSELARGNPPYSGHGGPDRPPKDSR
jgi:hypothetical protein